MNGTIRTRSAALLLGLAMLMIVVSPMVAMAKTSTKIIASLSSTSEHYDSAPRLTGTLKTRGGKILRGKTVSLYRNGRRVGSKKTNSSGKVTFSLVLPTWSSATWYLRYGGSSGYKVSTSTRKQTSVDFHFDDGELYLEPIDTDADGYDDIFLWSGSVYLDADTTYECVLDEYIDYEVYAPSDSEYPYQSDTYTDRFDLWASEEGDYSLYVASDEDLSPVGLIIW
ncbi:MAG: hypothetical protein HGB10_09755 [Coriobacteriia bacterium]|nr:hypothetical protein [Coriobacteriia bacterium]